MKIRFTLACLIVALTSSLASAQYYPPGVPEGSSWVELFQAPTLLDAATAMSPDEVGCWEYVYDVYGGSNTWFKTVALYFDSTLMVNQWTVEGEYRPYFHMWTSRSAGRGELFGSGWLDPDYWPSNWKPNPATFQFEWMVNESDWGLENTWHLGSEYGQNDTPEHVWYPEYWNDAVLQFNNYNSFRSELWMTEGLSMTVRVVHPYAPGDMDYFTSGYSGTILGPVMNPEGRLGDFDGDGDIDADDIDALGAAIQAGSTDTEFDMDGDGDVDADDFTFHVTTLVDTALGEGTGTAFGDFNLDGVVGILDLGLLGDGYNAAGGWASGDANGDGSIGILDLGLLGDNYGYDGSAIPEPATMSLLGLGAVAILRRRSR